MNFQNKVDNYKDKKIILAVSGGVDSMSLWDILEHYQIDYILVHINHQTRGLENEREQELIEKKATKLSRKLYIFYFENGDGNFHENARNFRMMCYNNICIKENTNIVFLGHHKDDQIENLLLNENKIASGLMCYEKKISNLIFVRPLLDVWKKDIYSYAEVKGINFFEDSSNELSKYQRNKIRKTLKKISTEDKEKLLVNALEKEKYIKLFSKSEKLKIVLLNKYTFDQKKLILYGFLKSTFKDINISYKIIEDILSVNYENGMKEFSLQNGKKVYYFNGYITKDLGINLESLYEICQNKFPGYKIKNFVNGDHVIVNNHKKKVSRIFIDKKIPRIYRKKWPLVCDGEEIIYIPELYER